MRFATSFVTGELVADAPDTVLREVTRRLEMLMQQFAVGPLDYVIVAVPAGRAGEFTEHLTGAPGRAAEVD